MNGYKSGGGNGVAGRWAGQSWCLMAVVWLVAALAVGQTAMAQAFVDLGTLRSGSALDRSVVLAAGQSSSTVLFRQPLAVREGEEVDVRLTVTFNDVRRNNGDAPFFTLTEVRTGSAIVAYTTSPAAGGAGRVYAANFRLREGAYSFQLRNTNYPRHTVRVSLTATARPVSSLWIDVGARRNDWINQPTAALPAPWNRMVYVYFNYPVNPSRQTIVLVHGGFLWNPMSADPANDQRGALNALAAEMLRLTAPGGANVVAIDWSSLSRLDGNRWLGTSGAGMVQECREAARAVAEQLDELGIANSNVSLVGYSFGGSFIGELAQALRTRRSDARVRGQTGPVRSILALDPVRIDKGDVWNSGWEPQRYDALAQWSMAIQSTEVFGSSNLLSNGDMVRSAHVAVTTWTPYGLPLLQEAREHAAPIWMCRDLVRELANGRVPFSGRQSGFAGLTRDYFLGGPNAATLTVSRAPRSVDGGFTMQWIYGDGGNSSNWVYLLRRGGPQSPLLSR